MIRVFRWCLRSHRPTQRPFVILRDIVFHLHVPVNFPRVRARTRRYVLRYDVGVFVHPPAFLLCDGVEEFITIGCVVPGSVFRQEPGYRLVYLPEPFQLALRENCEKEELTDDCVRASPLLAK